MPVTENPEPHRDTPDARGNMGGDSPRTADRRGSAPPALRPDPSCVPDSAPPWLVAITRVTLAVGFVVLLILILTRPE